MKHRLLYTLLIITLCSWGFTAHKDTHAIAITGLPSPLFDFCKANEDYIISEAVAADRRKFSDKTEGIKHYIDLDLFSDSIYYSDSTAKYGTLPWTVTSEYNKLVWAITNCEDKEYILKLMVDLGHYVGDAHVPLHTTSNYNGQFTNQKGIHSLWETHVYELTKDTWVPRKVHTIYIGDVEEWIWEIIYESNSHVDDVLSKEAELTEGDIPKMGYRTRGRTLELLPTPEFCEAYADSLDDMVEDRFYQTADNISSIWYSAWVDAGSPNLTCLESTRESTPPSRGLKSILQELFSRDQKQNPQKQELHLQ